MKKKCVYCGLTWIVSIKTQEREDGYECPRCECQRVYQGKKLVPKYKEKGAHQND